MATPSTTLNNGATMPLFGFGTWLSQPNVVGESVKKALEAGYRHIDCAHVYGNEAEIGQVFHKFFSEDKSIKREDIFITSKLWVKDFGSVSEACAVTLKNLQLDYLDLYLIHLPFEVDPKEFVFPPEPKGNGVIGYKAERIKEVWKEMEKLVKDGKVKAIGVSNFTTKKVKDLLKCPLEVPIACNQVELHPLLPQNGLLELCEENKIAMVAYGPLGNPGRPALEKHEGDPHLLSNLIVKSISEKRKATPAQVLLAYGLKRKTGVLCKSVNESRITENFGCLKVELDTDDMVALNAIETRHRFCSQVWARTSDQEIEDLWDGEMYA